MIEMNFEPRMDTNEHELYLKDEVTVLKFAQIHHSCQLVSIRGSSSTS